MVGVMLAAVAGAASISGSRGDKLMTDAEIRLDAYNEVSEIINEIKDTLQPNAPADNVLECVKERIYNNLYKQTVRKAREAAKV